jgi:predicted tellurium resistance membrane protein TerC
MEQLINQILDNPAISLGVIFNLIVIESLLSVDNAAVLATMVMDLPEKQRDKALKYGIWGAYFFRGLALVFVSFLLAFWWLKPLGGMYLLWLVADQFKEKLGYGEKGTIIFKILSLAGILFFIKNDGSINVTALWILRGLASCFIIYQAYAFTKIKGDEEDDGEINKSNNTVYKFFQNKIGIFWSTVILVEIMDMAFSIDNVFAAVALVEKFPEPLKYFLVCTGVFVGILAMRFVAQWFVKLMEKYNFLETAAFIVISILGAKLLMSIYEHHNPNTELTNFLKSHEADIAVSVLTVAIFFIPILTSMLFNFPAKNSLLKEN